MEKVEWRFEKGPVAYPLALQTMQERVRLIQANEAGELVWLLEHPPLYTAGTSSNPEDILDANRFPIYETGRGGQYTYHGPGQRVVYLMLNLKNRVKDVRAYVHALEQWIIDTLSFLHVQGERRQGRVGIWVVTPEGEKKIASIGVRMSRWVTSHGIALNINPTLSHFNGIVPCGLSNYGVTSLADLGVNVTLAEVDKILKDCFEQNSFLKSW